MFLAFDILDIPEIITLANFLKDRARTFFLTGSITIYAGEPLLKEARVSNTCTLDITNEKYSGMTIFINQLYMHSKITPASLAM